jgi:hypothetical protein
MYAHFVFCLCTTMLNTTQYRPPSHSLQSHLWLPLSACIYYWSKSANQSNVSIVGSITDGGKKFFLFPQFPTLLWGLPGFQFTINFNSPIESIDPWLAMRIRGSVIALWVKSHLCWVQRVLLCVRHTTGPLPKQVFSSSVARTISLDVRRK